jgi:hypothetical protein
MAGTSRSSSDDNLYYLTSISQSMTMSDSIKTLELDPAFNPAGFRLVDINGDGRSDWIYMHNTTNADIRINQRG